MTTALCPLRANGRADKPRWRRKMAEPKEELFTGSDWQDEQLAGELEGEWVEAKEGLVVEGKLERAFATADEGGLNPRACYAVRGRMSWPGADGKPSATAEGVFLLGERAAFKSAIRELKLGTSVRLTFIAKEPILRGGKKTGMEMWRMKFQSKRDGRGEPVERALYTYWRRNIRTLAVTAASPNPSAEEFVPF